MKKVLLVLPLFLTSCSLFNPYSSNFSCPGYHKGVCASIPHVYRMYKEGYFSGRSDIPSSDNFSYRPTKCHYETVCKTYQNCDREEKVCKKVAICKPDNVANHIDYRAQAVKDNSNKEVAVW